MEALSCLFSSLLSAAEEAMEALSCPFSSLLSAAEEAMISLQDAKNSFLSAAKDARSAALAPPATSSLIRLTPPATSSPIFLERACKLAKDILMSDLHNGKTLLFNWCEMESQMSDLCQIY